MWTILYSCPGNFYPRSPCGERLPEKSESLTTYFISIHALLAESDLQRSADCSCRSISIHALLAESDINRNIAHGERQKFLSTLSLRRATCKQEILYILYWISIHALLAESDCYSLRHSAQDRHFYPRSPCGERQARGKRINRNIDFYPRSPCGERLLGNAVAELPM